MLIIGIWGIDIFDEDISYDVKITFETALSDGLNVEEATQIVIKTYEEELCDDEDSIPIYLAIAKLQLKNKNLQSNIKKKVLEIIKSGIDVDRWENDDDKAKRKVILEKLKNEILKQANKNKYNHEKK